MARLKDGKRETYLIWWGKFYFQYYYQVKPIYCAASIAAQILAPDLDLAADRDFRRAAGFAFPRISI